MGMVYSVQSLCSSSRRLHVVVPVDVLNVCVCFFYSLFLGICTLIVFSGHTEVPSTTPCIMYSLNPPQLQHNLTVTLYIALPTLCNGIYI